MGNPILWDGLKKWTAARFTIKGQYRFSTAFIRVKCDKQVRVSYKNVGVERFHISPFRHASAIASSISSIVAFTAVRPARQPNTSSGLNVLG